MRHSCLCLCLFLGFFTTVLNGQAIPVALFPGVSQSTVLLNNATAKPQSILLELLPQGAAMASASRSIVLEPGATQQIPDLQAFLGANGSGMLRVSGAVATRVWLRDEEVRAVEPGQAIAPREEIDFPYSTPADGERDARSNLILVNLDTRDVTVTLTQGSVIARQTIPAGAFVQIDNLGTFLGAPAGIASAHAVADGRWFGAITTVRALAASGRRRAVALPPKLPPSAGLIDKALAAGTINAEQALTYKVFADFGDSRLPAAFRGDDSGLITADSPGLATAQWNTLSAATKDLIGPHLVPPFFEGSSWDARGAGATSVREVACRPWETIQLCNILTGWRYVEGSHVRVWYDQTLPADASVAADLARETDVKIWPELIRVMGREPFLPHEMNAIKLLDVVVSDNLPPKVTGRTISWKLSECSKDATWIAINNNVTNVEHRRSAYAHELFHAVQHTYETKGCVETNYKWLMESTGLWFEDQLYPAVNREHSFAHYYLDKPELAIDSTTGVGDTTAVQNRFYGGYTFFFYLTRFGGGSPTAVVRQIWEATKADQLHALQAGLKASGVPLEESWPAFAAYSWNEEAPFNRYKEDKLTDKAPMQAAGNIRVATGDMNVELGNNQMQLPHLSMRYFQFDFPDATASTVAFYNGLLRVLDAKPVTWMSDFGKVLTATAVSNPDSIKGAHVEALVKIDGKWTRDATWTQERFKTYCRDTRKERIESLIIILSNSDIENTLQPQGKYAPIVQVTNIGCHAWEGSADLTFEEDGRVERVIVNNLRLEAVGDVPDDEDTPLRRLFTVAGGTYQWSISGSTQGCTWSGPVVNEALGPGSFLYTFPYAAMPAAGARGILPTLFQDWLQIRLIVKQSGPTCSTAADNWHAGSMFLLIDPNESYAHVSADGKSYTLDGSKTPFYEDFVTGTWRLTAKRE